MIALRNTSNTATSNAIFYAEVGGTSAGDPFTQYNVGDQDWVTGIDNSVSGNPFVIAASSTPGTGNAVSITPGGAVTVTGNIQADSLISVKTQSDLTPTLTLNFNGSTTGVTGAGKTTRNWKAVVYYLPVLKAACAGPDAITITRRTAPNPAVSQSFSVPVLTATGAYATGRFVVAAGGTDSLFMDAGTASFTCTSSQAHGTHSPITVTYTLQ